jgi:hypothetical protein
MNECSIRGLFFRLTALFILLLLSGQARARIYIITDTNDTTERTSLRGAIIEANEIGGDNTIILGQPINHRNNQEHQWVYHLTISGADEDNALTGDLDITRGNLTIVGAVSNVTIDATGLGDRVFQVFSPARLTLENLVITGGTATGNNGAFGAGEAGGAIFNAGTLLLKHCIITNNSSGAGNEGNVFGTSGGDGGGIYNSGTLTLKKCIVAGNSSGAGVDGASGGNGGGIKNDGTCVLTSSIISENQSGEGGVPVMNSGGFAGSGGNGGGIFNSGTIVLNNCTISSNSGGQGVGGGMPTGWITVLAIDSPSSAGGSGGAIFNVGEMKLNFCTVNSNAGGDGGSDPGNDGNGGDGGCGAGIFNAGTLSLNTCTISSNRCGNGGNGGYGWYRSGGTGGEGGGGGGICNAASLDLTSCTIVLNETGTGGDSGNGIYHQFLANTAAGGGNGGNGGGVLNSNSTAVVMRNCLVALNLTGVGGLGGTNYPFFSEPPSPEEIANPGADGSGPDLAGDFKSLGFNLIGISDGSAGFVNGVNGDRVGSIASPIDPLLGPLQMNGGFTPTHALLPGSPAIDQGNCFGIHTDQCGHYRPHNYSSIPNAPGGDGSDIGAFELDTRILK